MTHSIIKTDNYLLVVDDSEIAIGDTVLVDCSELEVLDIRKVNDYYNEQFLFEGNGQIHMDYCKKIISHLPLNNSPVLEGVDLLPPLEDDVVKLVYNIYKQSFDEFGEPEWDEGKLYHRQKGFVEGYNKAKEKYKYTEEQLKTAIHKAIIFSEENRKITSGEYAVKFYKFYGELIQSPQQPKMPVAFECTAIDSYEQFGDNEVRIFKRKTTTTDVLTQWVGQYIY
jgi:hypothetical protein